MARIYAFKLSLSPDPFLRAWSKWREVDDAYYAYAERMKGADIPEKMGRRMSSARAKAVSIRPTTIEGLRVYSRWLLDDCFGDVNAEVWDAIETLSEAIEAQLGPMIEDKIPLDFHIYHQGP